jgi:tRNA (guanine-N7-)-methyltransferase
MLAIRLVFRRQEFRSTSGMARRALRKIDAAIDVSRHLKTWDDLPRPWNATALFGREAPIELEVGSGKGMFLLTASQQQPDVNFLGIELAPKYAEFCAARLAKRDAANARVACADAGRVFAELLPEASLAAVHVYFPDPWWKARHKKRRVMNERFVRQIERTLRPGGSLHFWSDVEEYFRTTVEMLAAETKLVGPLAVEQRPAEHDLDYRTNFERRVRQAGKPVYRAEYRKS